MRIFTIFALVSIQSAFAVSSADIIASLLEEQWKPVPAKVVWKSNSAMEAELDESQKWSITSLLPARPCGSMILRLSASDSSGQSHGVAISGNASVSVECLTVKRTIRVGEIISADAIEPKVIEWKSAFDEPMLHTEAIIGLTAERTLTPGRPICQNDIKIAHRINRGDKVTLHLTQGAIDIKLPGKAMETGIIGEQISAITLDHPQRIFRGVIEHDNYVHIHLH